MRDAASMTAGRGVAPRSVIASPASTRSLDRDTKGERKECFAGDIDLIVRIIGGDLLTVIAVERPNLPVQYVNLAIAAEPAKTANP